MNIFMLKKSITELDVNEALDLIIQIRRNRRISKAPPQKVSKPQDEKAKGKEPSVESILKSLSADDMNKLIKDLTGGRK